MLHGPLLSDTQVYRIEVRTLYTEGYELPNIKLIPVETIMRNVFRSEYHHGNNSELDVIRYSTNYYDRRAGIRRDRDEVQK